MPSRIPTTASFNSPFTSSDVKDSRGSSLAVLGHLRRLDLIDLA